MYTLKLHNSLTCYLKKKMIDIITHDWLSKKQVWHHSKIPENTLNISGTNIVVASG